MTEEPYYRIKRPTPEAVKKEIQKKFPDNFGRKIDKELKEVSKELYSDDLADVSIPSQQQLGNPNTVRPSQNNRDSSCMYYQHCGFENCLNCRRLK